MPITQITTVKGRLTSVLKNLPRWLSTDIDELVLVDYDCPEHTASRVTKTKHFKDHRLKLVRAETEFTGPYYNHGRARNIGAQAAKYDIFLFLDADCYVFPSLIEAIKQKEEDDIYLQEVICTQTAMSAEHVIETTGKLPTTWAQDGQLFIKNAVFYDLNGFVEDNAGWGCETYDLVARAAQLDINIRDYHPAVFVNHVAHNNDVRDRYLPRSFKSVKGGRNGLFMESWRDLKNRRKTMVRAQPGKHFGLTEPSKHVYSVRQNGNFTLVPGESDGH